MKKLLALLLVLGLATAANAGLIETVAAAMVFSVDGEPQPAEITIYNASDSVILDLDLLEGHSVLNLDFTWTLSNDQAELLTGSIALQAFDMGLSFTQADSQNVKIFGGQIWSPALAGPKTLVDQLELHCLDDTDVTLTIWMSGTTKIDGEEFYPDPWLGTVVHTLIIHQVPEPAMIVLLGLGSLLLRRRK